METTNAPAENKRVSLSRFALVMLIMASLAIGVAVALSVETVMARSGDGDRDSGFKVIDQLANAEKEEKPAPHGTPSATATLPPLDLNNWDPFKEMEQMRREMDDMFNRAFSRFNANTALSTSGMTVTPQVDLRDAGDAYVVTIDMPGIEQGALDVTVEDQELRITAQRTDEKQEEDEEKGKVLRRERHSGLFSSTTTLPGPVDSRKMTTEYKDGVYRVTIPKAS